MLYPTEAINTKKLHWRARDNSKITLCGTSCRGDSWFLWPNEINEFPRTALQALRDAKVHTCLSCGTAAKNRGHVNVPSF